MSADPADTTSRLRADIDSGRAGDKTDFSDPAAAPLGTDAEAGGTPPGDAEIARARDAETAGPPRDSHANAQAEAPDPAALQGREGERKTLSRIAITVAITAILVILLIVLLG